MRIKFAHGEPPRKRGVRYMRLGNLRDWCHNLHMRLRIKELRKERGWTGEHLADLIGSSKSYVSEIETGKKFPSGRLLKQLAQAFGVSVYEIIEDGELGEDLPAHLEVMKGLTAEDRKAVVRHALGLLDRASE